MLEAERAAGCVTVLAQLPAGAPEQPKPAAAVAQALESWAAEIEAVLGRVLDGSPLAE